ncbi:retinoblastoma-binding protein 5 homolog [Ctenocephalides felis]|uniref:retinoblastoma-binding protein 5 homolog n=1 Tax=Ctenocephalides felis TaxID=7515 RepID=UPI000E6E39BF|nr:retinoblastoma-binding protein 5 homolog [Ctenocephalides felis]XP_026462061.1 retinoblastoma-binding protein 5 homolog [Ctenocephalides felis]
MNLELLESFGQNYPEEFDGSLDCISLAVTCCFNKRGTLLAVGCNDGRIVIWDFLTRGIAKVISAHVHPICSLSWSRSGRKLLSASTDNNVCVWDVLSGDCIQKYRFPCPIMRVQFHPRNEKQYLVCPMRHAALLVDDEGEHKILPVDDDGDLNIVASFDRRGQYVYTGNSKGKIIVMSSTDFAFKASFRITVGTSNATAIRSIEFARRGECFLVNTADRVIRVYDAKEVLACGNDGEPEPIQKLQDLVNKTMWKKCTFSGDGEYICAGSARQHALYVWEKSTGSLVKILHGTKGEMLLDVVWHPVRPIIASISSGVVSVWAQNQVENWSAFAPDFKELDENVEYEERESEFDVKDEDKSVDLSGEDKQDEDFEVDVTKVDVVAAFCSTDEGSDDDSLQFLPIAPEVEDPEEWETATSPQAAQASGQPPEKKRNCKSFDIELKGVVGDEQHPLLSNKTNKDKQTAAGGKKGVGRPRK